MTTSMLRAMFENSTALTRTDIDLARLVGAVEVHADHCVVLEPENPTYRWGNFILLPGPPSAIEIEAWLARGRQIFDRSPRVDHVHLRWDGDDLSPRAREYARTRGMTTDMGLEMIARARPTAALAGNAAIRRLDPIRQRESIVSLNIDCDPSERTGDDSYRAFKRRRRNSWWRLCASGRGAWWGAFRDGRLLAQCGLVLCSDGLARFQSVETHPDHRRQGLCSDLIRHVGTDAFDQHGVRALLLGVDAEGPALRLYERLGFVAGGIQRSLLDGGSELRVREEQPGDAAEIASITRAAFQSIGEDGRAEVRILDALRGDPATLSLVVERPGTLIGHALFTRIELLGDADWSAMALGPVSVRPSQQRSGVGRKLIEAGIERCRASGHSALFVLGDPEYYARFGFAPAAKHGFSATFDAPVNAFQVLALHEGSLTGRSGELRYDDAFSI